MAPVVEVIRRENGLSHTAAADIERPGGEARSRSASSFESIVGSLRRHAASRPGRTAIVYGGRQVSYGELWVRTMAVAEKFARLGLRRGDRVLLAAPSSPAFACAYLAIHALGAVAVPMDPHAPMPKREELIARTKPCLTFCDEAELHRLIELDRPLSEREERAFQAKEFLPPQPSELADLMFTTGTTGRPKGVRLSHGNLASAARHINAVIGNDDSDVEILPLPLFHSFGLGRLRCSIVAGGTVVLVDGFRLPGEIFAAMGKHGATGLSGVPSGLAILLHFGNRGLGPFAESLKYVEIGSAPMPIGQKQVLMALLPDTRLWMHYGMTEASRSLFIEFHRDCGQLGSIGKPVPGVQLAVRAKDGSPCAEGEPGLLWIRGPHVTQGYWDDAELNARVFDGDWICSGDVVHIDSRGFVFLRGRSDDMINVGGFNVSPEEIERALVEHPDIADAACVGVPDPRRISDQVVRAYVVGLPGVSTPADEELTEWIVSRLEGYKAPAQYLWVESVPRSASGKLQRKLLRGHALDEPVRISAAT